MNACGWSRSRRAVRYAGCATVLGAVVGLLLACGPVRAQQAKAASKSAGASPTAQAQAAFDATGYWVSLITQDWRFRMLVPGKGEYADVPINLKAKALADAWSASADEAAGKQCEAYGAAVIMRNPERLHITWANPNTLQVDTDAGMQTRLLRFLPPSPTAAAAPAPLAAPPPHAPPSWQGQSVAQWLPAGAGAAAGAAAGAHAPRHGSLEVVTNDMLPGLLRKNGIPYSEHARMTEYWDLRALSGQQWISISVTVEDPLYLQIPYIYDSVFQKEPDGSKWAPAACTLRS
ncbi:MAG: hypothetical protein ACREU2_16550 [Steroidobacteraceae bacterium]